MTRHHQARTAAGTSTYRIRIVSLPPTPYVQWELHVLRLRDETGGPTRILLDTAVAGLEDQGPLPDIQTMDREVMYQPIYDASGVADCGLRYTDKALVSHCRDFIADLYARGEGRRPGPRRLRRRSLPHGPGRFRRPAPSHHLADCEQALDLTDALRDHLTAVLALLQGFPDNRAVRLRAEIRERLA